MGVLLKINTNTLRGAGNYVFAVISLKQHWWLAFFKGYFAFLISLYLCALFEQILLSVAFISWANVDSCNQIDWELLTLHKILPLTEDRPLYKTGNQCLVQATTICDLLLLSGYHGSRWKQFLSHGQRDISGADFLSGNVDSRVYGKCMFLCN